MWYSNLYTEESVKRKELPHMKFQYSEKKVKLPGNVHAYAEKRS